MHWLCALAIAVLSCWLPQFKSKLWIGCSSARCMLHFPLTKTYLRCTLIINQQITIDKMHDMNTFKASACLSVHITLTTTNHVASTRETEAGKCILPQRKEWAWWMDFCWGLLLFIKICPLVHKYLHSLLLHKNLGRGQVNLGHLVMPGSKKMLKDEKQTGSHAQILTMGVQTPCNKICKFFLPKVCLNLIKPAELTSSLQETGNNRTR